LVVGGRGCAQRTLDITSQPSGALVYLNGEEVGRTPLRYYFEWYSDYDIIVRLEGYETLKTHRKIKGPLYAIPPIDLLSELFGVKTKRQWQFTLEPKKEEQIKADELIARGEEMRKELRSSKYTRPPTTYPTTTRPTTRAAFPF
jgi:hypothetical protein